MKTITVEYDGVLTRPSVAAFIRDIKSQGVKVEILTNRSRGKQKNEDLLNRLDFENLNGIKINYLNSKAKSAFLKDKENYLIHLDIDYKELTEINEKTATIGVNVKGNMTWHQKAKEIIKHHD